MKALIILLVVFGISALFLFIKTSNSSTSLENHTIDDIGLSFTTPEYMHIREDVVNDESYSFYVESEPATQEEYYQLYVSYTFQDTGDFDKSIILNELESGSIVETTISGYDAIQGRDQDESYKYFTVIITDRGLLTFSNEMSDARTDAITSSITKTLEIR